MTGLKNGKLTMPGSEAIAKIKQIKADVHTVIPAIDTQTGAHEIDWEIAQIKKAMIESSRRSLAYTVEKAQYG